ncbi:hypothetical protein C6501_05325 [Candidatus Poribacteria bacterium]|nr:MAG: hypothetical protein C6501_05325 [Candidatus Poribacteria bacterium]
MFIVLIGCQQPQENDSRSEVPQGTDQTQETAKPGGNNGGSVVPLKPSRIIRDLEYLRSFAGRTENYDMKSVEESKKWLLDNKYTVTDIDNNNLLIQRNYVSGNITDRRKITISKAGAIVVMDGAMLTTDDEGNVRVGFFRAEE